MTCEEFRKLITIILLAGLALCGRMEAGTVNG